MPPIKTDYTGQRIGKCVALSYDKDRHTWLCRCDCGAQVYKTGDNLKKAIANNYPNACRHCLKTKHVSPYDKQVIAGIRKRKAALKQLGIWRLPNEEGNVPPLERGSLNYLLDKPRYQQPTPLMGMRACTQVSL